jgi:hypothetical protein
VIRYLRSIEYRGLLRAALNEESDVVIWEEVYKLLPEPTFTTDVAPSTPPPSSPPRTASVQQTPWTFNTGSFADTSDLRRNVDPILKDEPPGRLTRSLGRFRGFVR